MNSNIIWIEVWIDYEIEYPLILRALNDGNFEILDKIEQTIVASFDNYDDARYWLSEDEYDLVMGRKYTSCDV